MADQQGSRKPTLGAQVFASRANRAMRSSGPLEGLASRGDHYSGTNLLCAEVAPELALGSKRAQEGCMR